MTPDDKAKLVKDILDMSRQNTIGPLVPWFTSALDVVIDEGTFLPPHSLELLSHDIVHQATSYRLETGCGTAVIGMSGGVDSALTAAILKKAGWNVIGVTMPIHQNQEETDRGIEACESLGIEHIQKNLSDLYDETLRQLGDVDPALAATARHNDKLEKIRRGNVRARLRMITLYNLASLHGGLVASTDNFSELTAGFWTLHGDVGDLSPIQSLWKSWEVPYLAKINGVPETTWRATPTDGLGIDAGDEAQLGATYLEWDLMLIMIAKVAAAGLDVSADTLGFSATLPTSSWRAQEVFQNVISRMGGSWYKRMNPVNLRHRFEDRYGMIQLLDEALFRPEIVKD